jgi:hypothetical protein
VLALIKNTETLCLFPNILHTNSTRFLSRQLKTSLILSNRSFLPDLQRPASFVVRVQRHNHACVLFVAGHQMDSDNNDSKVHSKVRELEGNHPGFLQKTFFTLKKKTHYIRIVQSLHSKDKKARYLLAFSIL